MIVDFPFEDGLLFASLHNVSDRTALDVSVYFRRKFRGLGGRVSIPDLALFRHVTLLAPRRQVRTLVDTWHGYAARKEPTLITAWVRFRDDDGRSFRRRVDHDLSIYRDLAWVASGPSGEPFPSPPPTPDTGEAT